MSEIDPQFNNVFARLETREGGFVSEIRLAPYKIPAEIVLWGSRYFVHVSEARGGQLLYREGMLAFPIPN